MSLVVLPSSQFQSRRGLPPAVVPASGLAAHGTGAAHTTVTLRYGVDVGRFPELFSES